MYNNVTIIDYTYDGHGLGKVDGFPLFIPGTAVGDVVDVEVTVNKKNYAFAKVIKTHHTSTIKPVCKHYETCGGCQLMHLSDMEQLQMKRMHVQSTLARIAGLIMDVTIEPSPATLRYRNKLRFHVNRKRIGFHQEKSHNLVAIDDCVVGHELASSIAHAAPIDVSTKSIMIRVNAAHEVLLQIDQVDDKEALTAWAKTQPAIQSVYVGRNHVYGSTGIVETILGIECLVGSESFFQVHTAQAATMFKTALSWVDLKGKTVIDAYAGVGIIGMLASRTAASVVGIESVSAALNEAKQNIERNNITNMTMRLGLVELVYPTIEKADVFVLDPPRSGMDAVTIETLLSTTPKEILYFSCDPGTLSRDLKKLLTVYSVKQLQSFDMFSQTYHVETAVYLVKNV